MIQYGLACLLVCVLSLADRRAFPFALTILSGWLVGYAALQLSPTDYWRLWPILSAASAIVLTWLWRRAPDWRWKAVASLAGVMLLLDVAYLGFRWQRVPIEVEYARALDICLSVQLLLIGFRGAINVGCGLRDWLRGCMAGGPLVGHASHRKEAAE